MIPNIQYYYTSKPDSVEQLNIIILTICLFFMTYMLVNELANSKHSCKYILLPSYQYVHTYTLLANHMTSCLRCVLISIIIEGTKTVVR